MYFSILGKGVDGFLATRFANSKETDLMKRDIVISYIAAALLINLRSSSLSQIETCFRRCMNNYSDARHS